MSVLQTTWKTIVVFYCNNENYSFTVFINSELQCGDYWLTCVDSEREFVEEEGYEEVELENMGGIESQIRHVFSSRVKI